MKKKNYEDSVKEYERKCRKYRPTEEKLKLAIEEKNIEPSKFFKTAFKYELLYSLKAAAGFKYIRDFSDPFCSFFLRRFLESYAILFADYEGKLYDVNYKIFKASITKVLGKNESDKFKKQLGIKSNKHILELLETNPYYFLSGATENDPSPFELLRSINIENKQEELEQQKILENYRITSCIIHYLVDPVRSKPVVETVKKMYESEVEAFKKYCKEENKNNGQLGKETDIDLSFVSKVHLHQLKYSLASTHLFEFISHNENTEFLREAIYFFDSVVSCLNTWFTRKEYSYILSIPKIFFEKAPIYYELLSIKSVKEMQERLRSFEYIMDYKIVKNHEDLIDDEDIDDNLKKIYQDFIAKKYIKGNYFDFKKNALENPAYLIYSQVLNFTDIANKFPKIVGLKDLRDTLKELYYDSINYSHSYGRMIKEKEEDYYQLSLTIALTVYKTFINYLDKLKEHPIIILDLDAQSLIGLINVIQNEIKEFYNIYLDIANQENLE